MLLTPKTERRYETRVRYASPDASPHLKLVSGEYHIVDLTEKALKFVCPHVRDFRVGQLLAANVVFPDGRVVPTNGKVLRVDPDGVVVLVPKPIPAGGLQAAGAERRAYFRLAYPTTMRPQLHVFGTKYHTCEISEKGIRLLAREIGEFRVGDPVHAVVTFHDGERLPVVGTVLRLDRGEVVVKLTRGIPESRVMKEQRYLIQKFRHL